MTAYVQDTNIPGLRLVSPRRFADARGTFEETWNRSALAAAGISADFVQDNQAFSREAGTLRGLHLQAPPHAQAKLVRCTRGAIYDVGVDARRGSPSYGRWQGFTLTPENGLQLFLPEGFLHGYVTLAPDSEVQYKCTAHYAPLAERCVRWDSLGISWPLDGPPVISPRDAEAQPFSAFETPFSLAGAP